IQGDDAQLDHDEAKLTELRKHAARLADRISALEELERRQAQDEQKRRRQALVEQFERTLAEADAAAEALQATVGKADRLFRRVIELREAARAYWPHSGDASLNAVVEPASGCALSGHAVKVLLSHELYRVGAHPRLGGRPGEHRVLDFPGGM